MANSKHEAQNSKQIQNQKLEIQNGFKFGKFEFRYCFGFRISDLGFSTGGRNG